MSEAPSTIKDTCELTALLVPKTMRTERRVQEAV